MRQHSNKTGSSQGRIDRLVDSVLEGTELFRVQARLAGSGRVPKLDVFIDGDSGVTIEQCASVSRSLRAALQLDGALGDDFRIDVSSPGLGRPLLLPRQFRRHIGHTLEVKVKGSDTAEGHQVTGTLVATEDEGITVEDNGGNLKLSFDQIEQAVVTPTL